MEHTLAHVATVSDTEDAIDTVQTTQTMSNSQMSKVEIEVSIEGHETRERAKSTQTMMFYDGGCPLCSREVAHYQRLDSKSRIVWIDIHANPRAVDSIGVKYEDAMARLHVRDGAGEIQTGVWAFAAVWDALPYYRWLARILRALRLIPALDVAYTRFARWRLRRRACATGSCTNA